MINAEEAKRRADEFNQNQDEFQLADIEVRVKNAVAKGQYACYLSSEPSANLKKRLQDMKYTVKVFSDQRDGGPPTVTLTWSKPQL